MTETMETRSVINYGIPPLITRVGYHQPPFESLLGKLYIELPVTGGCIVTRSFSSELSTFLLDSLYIKNIKF